MLRNNYKKRRLIFVSSIFLISLLAMIFIIKNFKDEIVFFYSPSEIEKIKDTYKDVRVGGLVKENSIKNIDNLTIEFVITDLAKDLKIRYQGLIPNLFRQKQGVVAKGKFNHEENLFIANDLLIKHDENYMPPEIAKSIKN